MRGSRVFSNPVTYEDDDLVLLSDNAEGYEDYDYKDYGYEDYVMKMKIMKMIAI